MKASAFLSFDVEALPGRAAADPIATLVWGRLNGEEYGIKRICRILREYGLKANFLIDLSGCLLYGDRVIGEIGRYLLSEGHELHAHLHSEWVVRKWGIKGEYVGPPALNQLDAELNQHLVNFAQFKFRQLFGSKALVLRGGGFSFNEHTVSAARQAGFACLSNFNAQRHAQMLAVVGNGEANEPFSWGGGLCEIPVDFSPEPLSFDVAKYYGWYDRVRDRKQIKTFNLTLHSWSLLTRSGGDVFHAVAPAHEDRLREICEHLATNTQVLGYSEYLADADLPLVVIKHFYSTPVRTEAARAVVCTVCDAVFVRQETDICPGCGSRARHRQVVDALNKVGNPFDGRRVLACFANSVEKLSILARAWELQNFDIRPVSETDFQMDIQHMDEVPAESFDCFLAMHVLNHVRDDGAALAEIQRILRPGGVALITIPYRSGEATTALSDVLEHYGAENYAKYGVGSYRRYGLDDAVRLFSSFFEVSIVAGIDSVSNESMNIFLLRKR